MVATALAASTSAEKFILKAKIFVEKHVANEELSVEMLADERISAVNNVTAKSWPLPGMSPSTFIRKFRLQKSSPFDCLAMGAYIASSV